MSKNKIDHKLGYISAPYVYTKLSPAKPTIVFDTYWKFAAERQRILFKRLNNERLPWTLDPILTRHKFTNAYRATDRVSQYLIKDVIYNPIFSGENAEVFFRIILFKLFNKIETWKTLLLELGNMTIAAFNIKNYDKLLHNIQKEGKSIYSAAYIMPSVSYFGYEKKHTNHLYLLKKMMDDKLYIKIEEAETMQNVFELLKGYPSIGDFLAYQYAIDINYSNITDFSESEFVVPGPGAKAGISKCFADLGGLTEVEIIKLMADRQDIEFERLGLDFIRLEDRPLQLIDCQNLFCETDKYARIAHPEVRGDSDRQRIKQNFTSQGGLNELFLPPKWKNKSVLSSAPNKLIQ